MTTAIRRRRGTTAQHSTFIGLEGETTIDTDKEVVVVHDGTTQGGFPLMRENGSNSALALGSAGTPSLKFTGDTNTGIYSPGADQVAISTGGSGRLFVDASGNVGVGASSLSRNFTVRNASTIVAASLVSNPTNIAYLLFGDTDADAQGRVQYNNSTDSLELYSAGSERLRITSAGLVGVGTSSPTEVLTVSKAESANTFPFHIENTQNWGWGVGLKLRQKLASGASVTDSAAIVSDWDGDNNSTLEFYTVTSGSLTEKVRITPSGRVGIGTSSPSSALDVSGAISLGAVALPSAGTARIFSRNTDSNLYIQTGSGNTLNFLDGSQNTMASFGSSTVTLQTGNSPRLSIDSSGRVGIGTTTPDKLITAEGATAPGIKVKTTSSASYSTNEAVNDAGDYIQLFANGSARAAFGPLDTGETGLVSTKSLSIMAANSNQVIKFATGGSTERARIDSSGRLLVGTSSAFDTANTGTAWLMGIEKPSGYSALSIKTNEGTPNGAYLNLGKSRGTSANSKTIVSNNDELGGIYFEGADGSAMRLGASVAAFVDGTPGTNDMPGRLVFSTTADGASSPTERMRIASNGNVYIGGGTSFGSGGWTTQNSGEQVNQYSQTSDVRTLYNWSTNNNGTNTSVVYVQSDGKIYARTTTLQAISSERRLKENIVPLNADDAWETVKSVPFYSYNFIGADPSNVLYGPMADEVPDEMRVPTSQSDDVGVIHTYDNGMLQARLYVALQAALNKIETLEAKVAALESA